MQKNNLKNVYFYGEDKRIAPDSLEHGYLLILNDDVEGAKKVFENLDSPRAHWAVCLTSILKGVLESAPTYFQIRNFLEIDLDFLIKNEKIDYVEMLLGALDILSVINHETFKYTARVMLANNLMSAGFNYMEKSKKVFYNDPELHFMYAKYYFGLHNYKRANFYIDECLSVLPDYYPALQLKEEIEENLF